MKTNINQETVVSPEEVLQLFPNAIFLNDSEQLSVIQLFETIDRFDKTFQQLATELNKDTSDSKGWEFLSEIVEKTIINSHNDHYVRDSLVKADRDTTLKLCKSEGANFRQYEGLRVPPIRDNGFANISVIDDCDVTEITSAINSEVMAGHLFLNRIQGRAIYLYVDNGLTSSLTRIAVSRTGVCSAAIIDFRPVNLALNFDAIQGGLKFPTVSKLVEIYNSAPDINSRYYRIRPEYVDQFLSIAAFTKAIGNNLFTALKDRGVCINPLSSYEHQVSDAHGDLSHAEILTYALNTFQLSNPSVIAAPVANGKLSVVTMHHLRSIDCILTLAERDARLEFYHVSGNLNSGASSIELLTEVTNICFKMGVHKTTATMLTGAAISTKNEYMYKRFDNGGLVFSPVNKIMAKFMCLRGRFIYLYFTKNEYVNNDVEVHVIVSNQAIEQLDMVSYQVIE